MAGPGVELAAEPNKNIEALAINPTDGKGNQLSTGSLELLKQGAGQVNRAADVSSIPTLPDLAFMGTIRPQDTSNPNLAMGNPSDATADVSNANNFLIVRDQYIMSYNNEHKTPNWVSWQLDSDWLGSSGRTGPFIPDQSLPAGFDRVTPGNYTNSGYDRGHNIPSGDRTRSHDDNESTFLMSNVAPQTPDNNRGPWEKFENYCRELANEGKELYIIDGSTGSIGTIANGINVPEEFWKIVVVLPQKGMGPADVTADTEIIALEVPNVTGIRRNDWREYTSTVAAIEQRTGYHFLSNLPADVEKALANKTFSTKH